jgi:hypothetical protein
MKQGHYLCSHWGEVALTGSFALITAVIAGAL